MQQASRVTAELTERGFRCKDESGREVMAGGTGPKAGDLLLMAIAGCGGATLRAIMTKEGWNLSGLDVFVEGVRSEDKPVRYAEIKVHYAMKCKGLSHDKAAAFVKTAGDNCFVMQSISSGKHHSFTLEA